MVSGPSHVDVVAVESLGIDVNEDLCSSSTTPWLVGIVWGVWWLCDEVDVCSTGAAIPCGSQAVLLNGFEVALTGSMDKVVGPHDV